MMLIRNEQGPPRLPRLLGSMDSTTPAVLPRQDERVKIGARAGRDARRECEFQRVGGRKRDRQSRTEPVVGLRTDSPLG